jgi:hypothetical protein
MLEALKTSKNIHRGLDPCIECDGLRWFYGYGCKLIVLVDGVKKSVV